MNPERLVLLIGSSKEETMAILKAPPKQVRNATIQVRVEEGIKLNLDSYSKFIGAKKAYVVSEALRLPFEKADEFKQWLNQRQDNSNDERNTETARPRPFIGMAIGRPTGYTTYLLEHGRRLDERPWENLLGI